MKLFSVHERIELLFGTVGLRYKCLGGFKNHTYADTS